jgi:SSS family solute:Na+ symporter/sodium/pantothenate symporter
MSTVSGFLLIVASALVRDVYQRFLRPGATEREVERASYLATAGVGVLVALAALRPTTYLQLIVVFSGSGMAASFLAPAVMACYWRRATAAGAIAAMVAGAGVTLGLYALGTYGLDAFRLEGVLPDNPEIGAASGFRPYYLLGFDPCVWGIGSSLVAGVVVSLLTRPPEAGRLAMLFEAQPPDTPTAPGRPEPPPVGITTRSPGQLSP